MATKLIALCFILILSHCLSNEIIWDHSVDLDENYRLLWQVKEPDITFEIQVQTTGIVGFGFARNEHIYGADVVIGYVENENIVLQDRHVPVHSQNGEPILDISQDYILLAGHKNRTHTTLRFRRKLSTCDEKHDVSITNDTMKIVFLYHDDEPRRGALQLGSFPDPELALKPIKSLLLLQRPKFEHFAVATDASFEVTTKNILLVNATQTCSLIEFASLPEGHITAFRPVFEPVIASNHIRHMFVFECSRKPEKLDNELVTCASKETFNCVSLVGTWSKGSQGFVYPEIVGCPLKSDGLYLLQIHYEQFKLNDYLKIIDSAGFKFFTTSVKRQHDAGLLTVGIQPGWTHIIPPGLRKVTSIGYCTGQCSQEAFSPEGIHVVGVHVQTNEMGKSVKVGLVRNGTELQPIAHDHSIDSNYLEYRAFEDSIEVHRNDDLIVECSYNSFDKSKLTLGGFEAQQEVCQATLIYYPRQEKLTSCQSKPKTKNFLKALSIDKLQNVPPFAIELPEKYSGKTLEEHLKTYNWKTEFNHFEKVSKTSTIDVVCTGVEWRKTFDSQPVSIKTPIKPKQSNCERTPKQHHLESENNYSKVLPARSKVSRSTEWGIFNFPNQSPIVAACNWLVIALVPVAMFV